MATHTWSVGELCGAIRDTLRAVFQDELWIEGEISGFKPHSSGHVYFDLVEPDNKGRQVDKMSVVLWKGRRQDIDSLLNAAAAGQLTDGIKVRIRGELSFYAPQGRVQVQMTSIDPHHTLGQLAVDRDRVLQRLAESNLLEANSALPIPAVPLHVGLITSEGSAAYNDFVKEITSSAYPFRISLAHSAVQGSDAPTSLANSLGSLIDLDVDVIAIVRGGGARTDLMAFDLESVAHAVATCPVPVLSGIGHEIDRSVVDEVAHTAYKTPTACAAAIVQRVARFDQNLTTVGRQIVNLASNCHNRAADAIASTASAINDRTQRTIGIKNQQISAANTRVRDLALMSIERHSQRLGRMTDLVAALHPQRTLARGFSITRNDLGEVVRGPIAAGSKLVTETADSVIKSTVSASKAITDKETQ